MDRLTVLFASTTVALGATSAWFAQHLFSERQYSASLVERVAALESARGRVHGRPMSGDDSTLADRPEQFDVSAEPVAPQAAAQAHGGREPFVRFRESEARLLRSPEYRERWLAMKILSLRDAYDGLQALLGLSDAEYEAFLVTMAQFEHAQTLRNYEAPQQRGLDLAGRITASERQSVDTATARQQALQEVLGDAQYRQWVDHQRTAQGRQELERWRIELAVAGQPLTPGQAQDLLPILVEHQRRAGALPNGGAILAQALATSADASRALVESERHIASHAEINAWLDDALTGVLTMEQRDLVAASSNHEIELRRALLELNRLRLQETR